MSLIISISASINGGINQQKALRGYYYNVLKGNSIIESNFDIESLSGMEIIGFFALGYSDYRDGPIPFAPCYGLHMFGTKDGESCKNANTGDGDTEFIRVMNMYGICGATFRKTPQGYRNNFESSICAVK